MFLYLCYVVIIQHMIITLGIEPRVNRSIIRCAQMIIWINDINNKAQTLISIDLHHLLGEQWIQMRSFYYYSLASTNWFNYCLFYFTLNWYALPYIFFNRCTFVYFLVFIFLLFWFLFYIFRIFYFFTFFLFLILSFWK